MFGINYQLIVYMFKNKIDKYLVKATFLDVATFLENKRRKWFGHCLRRERNHICAKSLRLEVSVRRSRGRPKTRWRDNVKGDMKKYQLTEDMAQYRKYWPALHKEMVKEGEKI